MVSLQETLKLHSEFAGGTGIFPGAMLAYHSFLRIPVATETGLGCTAGYAKMDFWSF